MNNKKLYISFLSALIAFVLSMNIGIAQERSRVEYATQTKQGFDEIEVYNGSNYDIIINIQNSSKKYEVGKGKTVTVIAAPNQKIGSQGTEFVIDLLNVNSTRYGEGSLIQLFGKFDWVGLQGKDNYRVAEVGYKIVSSKKAKISISSLW